MVDNAGVKAGSKVVFTITVYSEQDEINIPHNAVENEIEAFLPNLLDAAELGMLDWTVDITADDVYF